MKDYMKIYQEWLSNPYFDEDTKAELRAIEGDENEIKERFYMDLEFGTAGLRGVIGAGINRMNIYVVRRATQGLANYIIKQGGADKGVAIAYDSHQQKVEYITGLKDYMTDRMASLPGVTVNSRKGMESAPQIVSASFQGVRSEVLLHALEDKGIYVSSGSACSSNHPAISGTLKAIGVRQELLDSTLRFSFGVFNTREEVDYCMEVLEELLPVLRRYHRG